MSRREVFVNRDGSTEAWDGDMYVPLGSMRDDPEPQSESVLGFPPPPRLYMVIEEYPPLTIGEFRDIAERQRREKRRKRELRKLLQLAARLAAGRGTEDES